MNWVAKVAVGVMAAALVGSVPARAISSGGSGGALTDRINQTYQGSQYTSKYHVYAANLDWSKSVGMLVYADGTAEYGLNNPSSSYLLGGTNGLINVAKRHNMVLVTPFSPNTNCTDSGTACWYIGDSVGYAKWAEELVTYIQGQYPIEKDRVAFGGYSSGAQLATEWWVPSGAAQRTMTAGVVVAMSFGGSPKMTEVAYPSTFKSRVHLNWNAGANDSSYTTTSAYGVMAGYNAYTGNGFTTSLDVIPGLGHARNDFSSVMEAQINEHVIDPFETKVQPQPSGAKFTVDVLYGTTPATYVYVYWGTSSYLYTYSSADGNNVPLTFSSLPSNTNFTYKVFSNSVQKASGSFRTP